MTVAGIPVAWRKAFPKQGEYDMNNLLFDTAPDFDQPIAVLKHCHDRIRKQLHTMQNLVQHRSKSGHDLDMQQAAAAVLRYFSTAAPQHHADEEQDLLPMLQSTAKGEDAMLVDRLLPEILEEHHRMDATWAALEQQLRAIASGTPSKLSQSDVSLFADAYAAHMEKEETQIAPMAKRLFSTAQMRQLGNAMRARRGIATVTEY
jgi:hemerythrin-like domain-containing protein